MAKSQAWHRLAVGVDLGPADRSKNQWQLAAQLLRQFDRYRVPATWTVRDFDVATVDLIRSSQRVHHEIGLEWDGLGVNDVAEVFQFNAVLRDRIAQAADLNIAVQALAVDPNQRVSYCALAKAGVRTVRPARAQVARQVRPIETQRMRFGIWGVPVSCFWPHPSRLWQRIIQRQIGFQARTSAQDGHLLHVVFDVPRMAEIGDLNGVERFLSVVAELQQRHMSFEACRLADVEKMARLQTVARPTRSILRRVA